MRIGILTLPLHTNYGGILQAYALQTVLERMGHEVEVLDTNKHFTLPLWKIPLCYGKRITKKLLGKKVCVFAEQRHNREYPIISQHTQKFIDKYVHQRIISNFKDLKENDYDAYVVGSDQVWRRIYFPCLWRSSIENAFLSFTKGWNVKRIAYAASFGTDKWEYTMKEQLKCGELARLFDAVSVREVSGVALCKEYLDVMAKHALDPTMLLVTNDYIRLFEANDTPKSKGTLLVYILDETKEKKELVDFVSKENKLIPFKMNSRAETPNASLEERIQPSVEQWLRGFYDAEFVVTDSFHACVFSILFKKQFVVYGNEERGMARFHSLLSIFGLEDRLVISLDQAEKLGEINYDIVYEKLETMREKSMAFLENALN